jgi:hypothetical protein
MKSNGFSDRLDLDRDLPTTPDDVAALRRVRVAPPMTLAEYFRFLRSFRGASREKHSAGRGPGNPVPFELSR